MVHRHWSFALLLLACAGSAAWGQAAPKSPQPASAKTVEFNRDIRPVLSDTCFKCHGFDKNSRKAELRLDTPEGSRTARDEGIPIVPGKPLESTVYLRMVSKDPQEKMPPPKSHLVVTPAQVELLRKWIEEGAEYEGHWAYLPLKAPAPPSLRDASWVRDELDRFVLAKLEAEGLAPSPEAPKTTLIRRATLDLTGLPPTPEEVDAFLQDTSANAYEKVVDRLLASPAYGERMAWDWLDAARYADSNGYQGDGERTMWPWRDWVVQAFNRNLPYDRFTVWQLAGDLLPGATPEQRLATGFCRNHPINGEGGRIAEENRIEYLFDQAETVGTVWLGLTLTCSRCHDHKYDPLSQKDYFSLLAFFNQTPVGGGDGSPQAAPNLAAPSPQQQAQLAAAEDRLAAIQQQLAKPASPERAGQERLALAALDAEGWQVLAPSAAHAAGQSLAVQKDRSVLASGANPAKDTYTITAPVGLATFAALRLEALRHESMTHGGLARSDSGNFVLTELEVSLKRPGQEKAERLAIGSAEATFEQSGFKVAGAFDGKAGTGWAVHEGKPVDRGHEAVFRLAQPVAAGPGSVITVVLRHDSPNASHNLGRFRLSVTAAQGAKPAPGRQALVDALRTPAADRGPAQAELVEAHLKSSDPESTQLRKERDQAKARVADLKKEMPKVMVMEDMPKPRKTFMLEKGQYNKTTAEVAAATPAYLPPMQAGAPRNRLGMAEWLVAPENPLTARVTANRIWTQFFGVGLVKTAEDFGVQGENPGNQPLLDHLASGFSGAGWDLKKLCRRIVTSATYRQSSRVGPELAERDPENRLLARGPRFRMPSWMIRDQALAAGGLLTRTVGGPPVRPYQPAGVWEEATFGGKRYVQDKGEALYRRSLYVFWRRIIGPTMFFDAAGRQVCSVKQARTNSPLHALTTLNDIAHIEAARALAQRVMRAAPATKDRIDLACRLVLARPATERELPVLAAALDRLRAQYAKDPKAAAQLLKVGESKRDESLDAVEHAAHTALCNTLLNLDEALTKE